MTTRPAKLGEPTALASAQPHLPLAHYRLHFRAQDPLRLPEYSGSAWRGVFGRALRKAVCVTRQRDCAGCMLHGSCVYSYVFETPPPVGAAKMRRYTSAPHPFVIEPVDDQRRDWSPGEPIHLDLLLYGRATGYLPYFLHAFEQAAAVGLGRGEARLSLEGADQVDLHGASEWRSIYRMGAGVTSLEAGEPELPPMPPAATVHLHTPLRVQHRGRNVTPERFVFADLFGSLLRRISMLTYFHTDTPLETDFAALTQLARGVPVRDAELRWHDWTRYSSRQRTEMQLGGLVGRFGVDLAGLEALWPYLWLGQWSHAGKAASMGLGRYTLSSPASDLPTRAAEA